MSGVTDNVATSLKNNTGLNPRLAALHKNCEDLNDVNDCLIGRKAQELEALDVCDWKDFMSGFGQNLYETLKAIIASDCGEWASIERLCASVDGLFGIIGGSGAKAHKFTPSAFFKENFWSWWSNGTDTPDDTSQWYAPSFQSEIRQGYGCKTERRMLAWRPTLGLFGVPFNNNPHLTGAACKNLHVGAVLGHIPKSAVVPHDMPESTWKYILRGGNTYNAFSTNITNKVWVNLRGYTVIDGVVFNEDLRDEYGEDTMVMTINALEDGTTGGGIWGAVGQLQIGWI